MTGKLKKQTLPAAIPTPWRARALLCVVALAAYANSFGLGLAGDSQAIVTGDARIREVSAENFKLILTKDYWWPNRVDRLYRPVTLASLMANYAAGGTSPAGYHWLNFLLHCANVCLLYAVAARLLGRAEPAFFAAALWAAHPIGTEAVTNIVGRADLLAAMAVLGGLLLYLRGSVAALFAVATVGVFSKESAAVLAAVMLLWDLAYGGPRRRAPAYAAVAASLALLFSARHFVFAALPWPQMPFLDNPLRGADFWTARLTAIKVIGLDLWLLLCPLHLSSDRSFAEIPLAGRGDAGAWIALLGVAGILGFAIARRRRDPLVFWLAGFAGIALLPASNLLFLAGTIMGERLLYLPAAAFTLALAALVYRVAPRRAPLVLGAVLLLYAGRTLARNPAWDSGLSLSSADVPTSPRSARLREALAKSLFESDERGNIDRVIAEQEAACAIVAPLPPALSSELPQAHLGIYYAIKAGQLGKVPGRQWYENSIAALLRAREIAEFQAKAFDAAQIAHGKPLSRLPSFQLLYFYLANDYAVLGRYPEALEAMRSGIGLDPRFADGYSAMAGVYMAAEQPRHAAVALLEKAQVDGFQSATLDAVRQVYGKVSDAACAFKDRQLNLGCPRVRSDLCEAAAGLAAWYLQAREPAEGEIIRRTAEERYGCPAH